MFDLSLTFSGIVLAVNNPDNDNTLMIMPDYRNRAVTGNPPQLPDGTEGVEHVGYIRYNLANDARVKDTGVPTGNAATGPSYEVVHRLDREELSFDFSSDDFDKTQAKRKVAAAPAASFDDIANALQPRGDLFEACPADVVLFRVLLTGGTFTGQNRGKAWVFPPTLQVPSAGKKPKDVHGSFACKVTWTRQVNRDDLPLQLTNLDTGAVTAFTLVPDANKRIELKFGNLCSRNVLEWPDFPVQSEDVDLDFKGYYQLFNLDPASLFGAELPYPRIDRRIPVAAGDDTCSAASVTYAF
jgi:hypothetical protein